MTSLFRRAEVAGRIVDVRVAGGVISEVGPGLRPAPAETVMDARGGALLPGLHDHHIHLLSLVRPSGPPADLGPLLPRAACRPSGPLGLQSRPQTFQP
jgi:cytosine/adenosine deaminase-related metal-dependent hydrolase